MRSLAEFCIAVRTRSISCICIKKWEPSGLSRAAFDRPNTSKSTRKRVAFEAVDQQNMAPESVFHATGNSQGIPVLPLSTCHLTRSTHFAKW